TKLTARTSGCASNAATVSPSPCSTLNTPSGSPASLHSSAISSETEGSFSDGFRMNVFPHAIAIGYIHIGTITGKLNGETPTATPSGWRIEYVSTSVETFSENDPLINCGMPHANSTTSSPRRTSPRASEDRKSTRLNSSHVKISYAV